jgi:hypothetical protein
MTTAFSMLSIMNAALISEGESEIVAENDGSPEWRMLSRNWPLIVEAELETGNYLFSRQQMNLLSRVAGRFGYADGYAVPADALHVRRVWIEDADGTRNLDVDWSQDGTYVYVNKDDGVWIEYLATPDPSFWSANFSLGVQRKLQAVILRFREEPQAAQNRDVDAENHFQAARTNSSKGRAPREPFRTSRFARARFGRG